MKAVRRLKLPLRCDNLTEALGDCFPLSVLQQLNRPEIFKDLSSTLKKIVYNKNQSKLRQEISNFMVTSRHPRLIDYKKQFEGGIGPLIKLTWDEYWTKMKKNRVWADEPFVQATAWYLRFNINIVYSTNEDINNPYRVIKGNIDGDFVLGQASQEKDLFLGFRLECHYQSLIPIQEGSAEIPSSLTNMKNISQAKKQDPCTSQKIPDYETEFPSLTLNQRKKEANMIRNEKILPIQRKGQGEKKKSDARVQKPKNDTVSQQREESKREEVPDSPKLLSAEKYNEHDKMNLAKEREISQQDFLDEDSDEEELENEFHYIQDEKIFKFKMLSDGQIKCNNCRKSFKGIGRHVSLNKTCKVRNFGDFLKKHQEFLKKRGKSSKDKKRITNQKSQETLAL